MEVLLAVVITWLVSPVMSGILTRMSGRPHVFPASITGAIGDTVFLPAFNATAVYFGVLQYIGSSAKSWSVLSVTIVFSLTYFLYRMNSKNDANWMYGEKGNFTVAGWYHFVYVVVQAFVIFSSLYHFYFVPWLWLALGGYVGTVILRRWVG